LSDNKYGDIYIVDGKGEIIFKKTFNDGIYLPAIISMDEIKAVLALPCSDGNIYFYILPGRKNFNNFICPFANFKRTGEIG